MAFKQIKRVWLQFPEAKIKSSEIHKIRGFFSNELHQFDLLHNHDPETGKTLYRYAAIQFKIIDGKFSIITFGDKAVDIFRLLFLQTETAWLEKKQIYFYNRSLDIQSIRLGMTSETNLYEFGSPWIALNQDNFNLFQQMKSQQEREEKLKAILINNIISFCKFVEYTIPDRLVIKLSVRHIPVNLKGESVLGFQGQFMINMELPDYVGLGKSPSRGYGWIRRIM